MNKISDNDPLVTHEWVFYDLLYPGDEDGRSTPTVFSSSIYKLVVGYNSLGLKLTLLPLLHFLYNGGHPMGKEEESLSSFMLLVWL